MRPPTRPLRLVVGSVVVLALLATGGTALGAWQGSGAGTGDAGTATTAGLTLSPGTPTADLYPGVVADIALVVANPNPYPVTIGSLSLDPGQGAAGLSVDVAHAGCATSWFDYTLQSNDGAGWLVPGSTATRDGSLSITLPEALAMDVDAADACQGATVTVFLRSGA